MGDPSNPRNKRLASGTQIPQAQPCSNDYRRVAVANRRGIFSPDLRRVLFWSMQWTSGEGPLLTGTRRSIRLRVPFTFGGLFLIGRSQQ
jgi:hypothetical protein